MTMYPTPRVDGGNNAGGSNSRKAAIDRGTYISGSLNPSFVEWMMGFPVGFTGWTDSEASVTPSSPWWLQQRSALSQLG